MKDVRELSDRELADYKSSFRPDRPEYDLCVLEQERRARRSEGLRSWIAIVISALALLVSVIALFSRR